MVADAAGNLFLVGNQSDNAFRVEPDGDIVEIIDSTGDGVAALGTPYGISVVPSGSVFVAGYNTDNVFEITPGGVITELMTVVGDGTHAFDGPTDIVSDACGNLFVNAYNSDNVFRVSWPAAAPDFSLGSKLVGQIDAADTDEFTFFATMDTKVSIIAKPTKEGAGTLVPTFTITAPDGSTLDTSDPKGKGAQIKNAVVKMTGLHVVTMLPGDTGTGGYLMKTKGKFPPKVKETIEVGVAGAVLKFEGVPGITIKTLKVKALPAKGDFATVEGDPSNLKPKVSALLAPCGAVTPLGTLKTNGSEKAVTGKGIALVGSGVQRLIIDGAGTVGFAKVLARLKFAKGKGEVTETN